MAAQNDGPEIKTRFTADLTDLKKGGEEAKKIPKEYSVEVEKAAASGKKLTDSMDKASSAGRKAREVLDQAGDAGKKVSEMFGSAEGATKGFSDIVGSIFPTAAGAFVTAALAVVTAIGAANEQVDAFEKSIRLASGTQQAYTSNLAGLNSVADTYQRNVFSIADGFNQITRETRGTILEGEPAIEIFETLTEVSGKLGLAVNDSAGTFEKFIDKMKQGTVDSKGLSSELDQRLFEAFSNVSKSMGVTNEQLNEVLKTSDEAVHAILPQLAEELGNALGDIPQGDARELADSIEYAQGKLVTFLDAIGDVSGIKTVFKQAADDAGDLLSQLTLLAKERGVTGAVLGLMDSGAETLLNGTGFKGPTISYARDRLQTPSMGRDFRLPGEIGNYAFSPDPITPAKGRILEQVAKNEEEAAEKANRKRIAEEKRLANERKSELDKIAKQEIYESEQRIKEAVIANAAALDAAYSKNHSSISPVGMLDKRGIDTGLDNGLNKTQKFSSDTGNSNLAPNLDKIASGMSDAVQKYAAGIEAFKNENSKLAAESLLIESVSDSLESSLMQFYGNMAAATDAGWGDVIAKINAGKLSYEEALLRIAQSDGIKAIQEMTKQIQIDLVSGISGAVGAITQGASGIGDLMKGIYSTFGGFLMNLGKQMLVTSGVFKGLKVALATLSGPVAALAGAAAIAAGAALKAYASNTGKETSQRLWTSGEVQGRAGVDNVPVMASPGEIFINQGDQNRLLGLIRGSHTGSDLRMNHPSLAPSGSGGGGGDRLLTEWRFDRLALAVKRGDNKNNRYE